MTNIILTGMPGVGKSTVGVVLAKRLGCRFIDSDLIIQEKMGLLLYQIIEEQGMDEFLKIENEVNASLTVKNAVVATGGSAVYGEEAMTHLKEIGHIIYLKLSFAEIEKRLGNLNERGVVLRTGQTLEDLYRERVTYYEKYADAIVDCQDKMIREIAADIVSAVKRLERS